jgi:methyl-accepting chemotaxis protein
VGVLIVVIAVSLLIARSIRRPLAGLAEACDKLAVGDFDFTVDTGHQDEAGKALIAMDRMKTTLMSLLDEMKHMSVEHDRGDIDVTIDAEKFAGGYRDVALGVNGMVAGRIAVKRKAMAVVKSFGEGDFDGCWSSGVSHFC